VPRIKVMVGDSADTSRRNLKDILGRLGYQVVADATSVPDLLRKTRMILPNLVVLDTNLTGGNALEAARIVEEDDLSSVLLLVSSLDHPEIRDFHYCLKPFSEGSLIAMIDAALLYRKRVRALRKELNKVREALDSRKVVEKAKGILMRLLDTDEEQAYRLLQKQSMNRGIPMKDIANAIILAHEVGRDKDILKGE